MLARIMLQCSPEKGMVSNMIINMDKDYECALGKGCKVSLIDSGDEKLAFFCRNEDEMVRMATEWAKATGLKITEPSRACELQAICD